MNALAMQVEGRLARAVQWTGELKRRPARVPGMRRLRAAIDFFARGVFHVWRNHRYISVPKLLNMTAVNLQFKLKTERVVGRPYRMKIESTNICNTQCQLCPTGVGLQGRPKGKMDVERYKQLIDRVAWHLAALDLSMWGDPLIVPEIYDMIRYAHKKGVWTYISSNLHALKLKPRKGESVLQAEQLVNSGLDMLTCSLHGASQKTFEAYQPGKSFDEAVAKVRHIIGTRDRMGSRTPEVQLNFVVMKQNEHERAAFERLADKLGCKAVFSWPALNTRFLDRDKQLVPLEMSAETLARKTREHLHQWLPTDPDFVLEPYQKMLDGNYKPEDFNGQKLFDCSWPWTASVVNWDGNVVTCCGSFDPEEDMGNVFDRGLGAVWNSRKYRLARRSFKRKLDAQQTAENPCATCPGFMV